MRTLVFLFLFLLCSGCQALAQWDRIGAGIKFKTVGWLESVAGLELEVFMGAERVPRTREGGIINDDDIPDWYKESWLNARLLGDGDTE